MRINISIWFGSLSIILSLAGCSTASRLSISTPQENASPGITATMSSVTPEPDSSPTHQPPATIESSPTVQPMASYIFLPYGSGGTRAWQVKDKQVSEITLPDMLMNSYDSAPSSGKVLYPSHFPDVGAGPANNRSKFLPMRTLSRRFGHPTDKISYIYWPRPPPMSCIGGARRAKIAFWPVTYHRPLAYLRTDSRSFLPGKPGIK